MPEWKAEILRRLSPLKLAPTREAEIADELSQHLEDRYQELLARGQSEDAASRTALDELKEEEVLARSLKRVEKNSYREPIAPGTVMIHYADAYSTYGPFSSGDGELDYFTLRAVGDPVTAYMPGSRHLRAPSRGRHFHHVLPMQTPERPVAGSGILTRKWLLR